MLRHLASRPELDLTVLFLSDFSLKRYSDKGFGVTVAWDIPLVEGYKHKFLPSLGSGRTLNAILPLAHVSAEELRGFDALWVHGYAHQVYLRAIVTARRLGLKVFLRGESHLTSHSRSPLKSRIKETAMKGFFKKIDGFLTIGTLNQMYYSHYGVPASQMFLMPYAVDNDFFRKQVQSATPCREQLRAELGLEPGRPIILFASKFQRRKRAPALLEAYIRLSENGREPKPYLVFIGDGEERGELEHRARSTGWSSIKFLGFKNQTELPRYYDLADVFVLVSVNEPWGLVVNEVMNAGKAVIVSDHVGAAPDLVRDDDNGYVIPQGDVGILGERLKRLTGNPDLMRTMGNRSLERIKHWNFEADAEGLIEALTVTTGGRRLHAGAPH
jgi:glycosyltransferase involved in cell wall biosynthesis